MTESPRPIRILIVDDHAMVREGLQIRLSTVSDLQVCGEATSEEEAMLLVQKTLPEMMIIDISLKTGNGIELVKRVKAIHPNTLILVMSGFEESLYAERALRAGARGYLNKQDSGDQLIEAIRTILRGDLFVSDEIVSRLVSQSTENRGKPCDPVYSLTDRELEIFRLIGHGQTSGAIARDLGISCHTIDTHRENMKRKLGLKTAAQLNRQAVQFLFEHN